MAAEHLTAIPRERHAAHKVQREPYFGNICPCDNNIVYDRFEDVRTFPYIFVTVVKVLVRKGIIGDIDSSRHLFSTED